MARTVSGRIVVRMQGAVAKAPPAQQDERLFVAIASYRDPECQWTVRDLFLKAARPERIFVGICWQTVPEEDKDCFEIPSPRPDQTRSVDFHVSQSEGVGWARAQAHKLWRGEEYVLNIDSHMRFVENWDERMIAQLKSCKAPKPVLSTYPPGYVPPDKLNPPTLPLVSAGYFDEAGVLINKSRAIQPQDAPSRPMPSMLYAAGFVFASSKMLAEVPYDPLIYFQGEEISMAVRLWTHGWDIFSPCEALIYHAYVKFTERKTHWVDNRDWPKLNSRSRARVAHLIGSKNTQDAQALADLDAFGLGSARSLDDYQRLSGIDFLAKTISVSASEGRFPLAIYDAERETRRAAQIESWRKNVNGNFETRSGAGSTLVATRALRVWLKETFARLGVRSLVDAGCGEAGWISALAEGLDLYVGVDIVEELIADNARVYQASRTMLFKPGDITRDLLPKADLILCRDTLTYLDNSDIQAALRLFRQSGASYLLATHHPKAEPGDAPPGQERKIDLGANSLLQAPPVDIFSDGPAKGKTLSLWRLND
ncbi:MAG: methyltransferase domain-containing protein [Alphaproteobacteria bacterium]|nr:methyltransferase domain-containing protein [Alphaproteobacteria bacterium]